MRVIDLLNKISNGEEVPSKIKYRNKIFVYDKDNQCYIVENYNEYDDLLMSLSNHKGTDLNYEVEIIEESKGAPEKIEPLQKDYMTLDDIKFTFSNSEMIIVDKINEIIDYLESKGK